MNSLGSKLSALSLVALLGMGSSGCIKKMLTDGQIESTRKGSAAFNTISDFETAERASSAGLAQFEGMHYLAPYNENALFLLLKGWSGLSFGFIEDEMERMQDQFGEDSEIAEYHRQRGVAGYSRAIFYGKKLLEMRNPGFAEASRTLDSYKAWLAEFDDPEVDAENLFWFGQAWMSRVNLLKDRPEYVAELFIGVTAVERSVQLDPNYQNGTGHSILGAYHARSAMAELDEAKTHFEEALRLSQGKSLLVLFNYATKYHCTKVDKEAYVKMLTDVVQAGDVDPEQRLQNTIAKRRARRYLGEERMRSCGF
jgi:tetratricopeptide (TPR) repeat protein